MFVLVTPGELRKAAESLRTARRVGIVSGFFLPDTGTSETDGPPGAVALGRALARLGVAVDYVTDTRNCAAFDALDVEPDTDWRSYLDRAQPTHLVSIERLSRARDGAYRNMDGDDVTLWHEPLDELFLAGPARGIVTIGIGDGGNEIGMGKLFDGVVANVRNGERIAGVVAADYCIVAGTSNWGAYGLIAALSVVTGQALLPSGDQLKQTHESLVASGAAVDGVTHRAEPTVDGIFLAITLDVVERLRRMVDA